MTTDDLFRIPKPHAVFIGIIASCFGVLVGAIVNSVLAGIAAVVFIPGVVLVGLMINRLLLYLLVRLYWWIVSAVLALGAGYVVDRIILQRIDLSGSVPAILLVLLLLLIVALVLGLFLMTRSKPEPQPKSEKPSTPIDRARQVAVEARTARQRIPD